jgi:hypothetical protein
MTDIIAILAGYTEEYFVESSNHEYAFPVLIKPDADLDGVVSVWLTDSQEFIKLNGWLWSFDKTGTVGFLGVAQ